MQWRRTGAPNVQLSLFDNVRDTTGLYNDVNGEPFETWDIGRGFMSTIMNALQLLQVKK